LEIGFWVFFGENRVILGVVFYFSAGSVCGSFARHFSAFSGLFQAL
jgi:hypothetical protein